MYLKKNSGECICKQVFVEFENINGEVQLWYAEGDIWEESFVMTYDDDNGFRMLTGVQESDDLRDLCLRGYKCCHPIDRKELLSELKYNIKQGRSATILNTDGVAVCYIGKTKSNSVFDTKFEFGFEIQNEHKGFYCGTNDLRDALDKALKTYPDMQGFTYSTDNA
jgi:hypothetical protein